MTEPTKSYYAIIPANVRYDKTIPANAKLLYGEITALCNEKGYCWARNSYFAGLYSVSVTTASRWVNQLVKAGYITSDLSYKKGTKEIEGRYIRICIGGIDKNEDTPPLKNVKDNTTLFINNTSNNKNIDKKEMDFQTFWEFYPNKVNKKKAFSAWKNCKTLPDPMEHLAIIEKWRSSEQWRNGYIPHPTTWINGERWEDTLPIEKFDFTTLTDELKQKYMRFIDRLDRDPLSANELKDWKE